MRAWSSTLPMTLSFLQISTSPSCTFVNTTTSTMLHCLHLPRTPVMVTQSLLAPQTLQHTMSQSSLIQLINEKNISRSSGRISRNVTHLDSRGANVRIGLTCTASLVMFFAFQVCSISPYPYLSVYKFLGSAVAIEQSFSSGKDTISICCTSLQPKTIHMVMVLKHHLHQMCEGNTIVDLE